MIKFAVSKPALRRDSINRGLTMLDWPNDPFLRNYGLKIDPEMLKTKARVLNPPDVQFAKGGVAKPGFSGRWDLRQKVFLKNNEQGLKAWGVAIIRGPGYETMF